MVRQMETLQSMLICIKLCKISAQWIFEIHKNFSGFRNWSYDPYLRILRSIQESPEIRNINLINGIIQKNC